MKTFFDRVLYRLPEISGGIALIVAALVLLAFAGGCVRSASGVKDTAEVIYNPRTGEKVYERRTGEHLKQETPADTSGPSTIAFEGDPFGDSPSAGGGIVNAGSHEKPLEAYLGEQRAKIFYPAGLALILAGVGVFIWVNRVAGVGVALAGLGVCFIPDILRTAGGTVGAIVAGVVVVSLVGGIAWALAIFYKKHRLNVEGLEGGLKLLTEGKPAEAVAAMRSAPIVQKVMPAAKAKARTGRPASPLV